MKTISKFLSLIISVIIVLIFLVNISNTITLESSFLSVKANVGFLILACSVLSSLATVFYFISIGLFLNPELSKYKKQVEKTKLNYELESDKVKQLEAKVNTLEEALKTMTKKP